MFLFGLIAVEMAMLWTGLWRWRKALAYTLCLLFTALSVWLAWSIEIGGLLIIFINIYQVIYLGKILEGRLHETYLLFSARRTNLWLVLYTLLAAALYSLHASAQAVIVVVSVLQLIAGLILLVTTIRRLRHTAPLATNDFTDRQLPTLTVAIPARNESVDLMECLESVLASRYPKLEVLVIDDSTAKRRPEEIIRRFAHEGVRFISSDPAKASWLPKNQAYKRLAEVSNGDLILFCGVDIRFTPDSLRQLVEQMITKNKQMLCVLPENSSDNFLVYSLIQPIRYAWELSLPRRLFNRPPVMSSCWIITKRALAASGGFSAVARMVIPELYFARELIKHDGYSFMRSDQLAKVVSYKSRHEQAETAIRTRYPRLHKRIELVALTTLAELILLAGNLPLLAWSIWQSQSIGVIALLATACIIQLVTYGIVMATTYKGLALRSVLSLTIAILIDVWLMNLSMWKYEFAKVYWKGRDVAPSVMHKYPLIQDLGKIQ